MVSLVKEVHAFASACEHLMAMSPEITLSDTDRGLIAYYLHEVEQKIEKGHKDETVS